MKLLRKGLRLGGAGAGVRMVEVADIESKFTR
jgi:hypothetical protein